MHIKNLKNKINNLSLVEKFFSTSIVTFLSWKALYNFLLIDSKIDLWMILNVVKSSSYLLNIFNFTTNVALNEISISGEKGILVEHGCNILKIFGIYISFIIGYPNSLRKKGLYCIIGLILLFIINIFRIASFTLIIAYYPEMWAFSHKYSSFIFFYPFIFVMWGSIIRKH